MATKFLLRRAKGLVTSQLFMQNVLKRRSSSIKDSTLPENLKRGFKKFQVDDGVPVYLKSGLNDVLLFRFTVVLVAIGVVGAVHNFVTMAFPSKKK